MKFLNLSKTLGAFALGFSLFAMSAQAYADNPKPDIATTDLTAIFTDSTDSPGTLDVFYNSQWSPIHQLAYPDNSTYDFEGAYNLTAKINDLGELISGTISIYDDSVSDFIIEGNLTDLSYSTTQTLEFFFDVTGGTESALYGDFGKVILGYTGFTGSFAEDFSSSDPVTSDVLAVSAVPEPSTYALFALGLLTVLGVARRKSLKNV
ncbi:MAG: PEP-CTERM sorting domain-containing protein [Pseudomonadota bacterium]|nr:PEP-CTERM sorting domain-containing protein [Pseudomonadota bacterium]